MSPRHVKAAARALTKEARKILKKYAGRIAAAPAKAMRTCVEALDQLEGTEDYAALEEQAKRLDELLHRHAAFARKSALRETIENIGIAVIIALGLRSCLYEPFKIPSGSMMPTLRSGDHIFVNKFIYGVQIPFTTTVIGESWGHVERGDVIVFRYPIDQTEDFIKRVIGLPGDEIRVVGRQVAIKRAGSDEFEVLERTRLERRCFDDDGVKQIANCTLYEETLDDHTYVVRYVLTPHERDEIGNVRPRVWKVPEGHLLVMGDNRNRSHDSLAWTSKVPAVLSEKILTPRDLRDLTDERTFDVKRLPEGEGEPADERIGLQANYDGVTLTASHRSPKHDLRLDVWREPTLGAGAIFETLRAREEGLHPTSMAQLLEGVTEIEGSEREALLALDAKLAAIDTTKDDTMHTFVVRTTEPEAVLRFGCGVGVCRRRPALARRVGDVLRSFLDNPEQEARLLLQRASQPKYTPDWSGRHNPRDHYWERRFAKGGEDAGPRAQVRLRAFRDPYDGIELVRDAALLGVGSSTDAATALDDVAPDSWLVDREDDWTYVGVDHAREVVVVMSCGKAVCKTADRMRELAATVQQRVPEGARDWRRLVDLLTPKDLEGLPEVPVATPELAEFDHLWLEATVDDQAHSVRVEAWLDPEGPLDAQAKEVADGIGGMAPDDAVGQGGYYGEQDGAQSFVFPVVDTKLVVRVTCYPGLCTNRAAAQALAERAATTALDASTVIETDGEVARPFVPRGYVKGRAERIWLPLSRFWLAIR